MFLRPAPRPLILRAGCAARKLSGRGGGRIGRRDSDRGRWGRQKRNGGRHRCQPPLRRAKDLPKLTFRSQGNPTMNFSSPAQASLPISNSLRRGAGPLCRVAAPEGSHLFQAGPAWPEGQSRPMFRGPSWDDLDRVPLCFHWPESLLQPRRAFGRSPLPAPRPGWPRNAPEGTFHCLPRRSDLWSPAAPSCRFRLPGEAGTAVPIT